MIEYTNYNFDFDNVEYKAALYSTYHVKFTKDDIAYRYRIDCKDSNNIKIIKRKVLYNDIYRFIYDPIGNRNTFLSGRAPLEGEVTMNIVWLREDNDIKAISAFIRYIKHRQANRKHHYILDYKLRTYLYLQMLKLLCNHTIERDGKIVDSLIPIGDDKYKCSICGKEFMLVYDSVNMTYTNEEIT